MQWKAEGERSKRPERRPELKTIFFKNQREKKKKVTSSGEKVQVQRENTEKRKGPQKKKKKKHGSCWALHGSGGDGGQDDCEGQTASLAGKKTKKKR